MGGDIGFLPLLQECRQSHSALRAASGPVQAAVLFRP